MVSENVFRVTVHVEPQVHEPAQVHVEVPMVMLQVPALYWATIEEQEMAEPFQLYVVVDVEALVPKFNVPQVTA